jgi:hypothetical protein
VPPHAPNGQDARPGRFSTGILVTIPLWTGFDVASGGMQFVELSTWIPRFNINYHLGVDGISMLFVILNAFITIIVVAAGWEVIQNKVAQYNAAFLIMSGLMNGIFTSLDGMLFYVFFEASLSRCIDHRRLGAGPALLYARLQVHSSTHLFGSLLSRLRWCTCSSCRRAGSRSSNGTSCRSAGAQLGLSCILVAFAVKCLCGPSINCCPLPTPRRRPRFDRAGCRSRAEAGCL